jgi:hypothetical protein
LRAQCQELALSIFTRKAVLAPDGFEATLLKAAVLLHDLQIFFRTERADKRVCLLQQLRELSEMLQASVPAHDELRDFLSQSTEHLDYLQTEPEPERDAWRAQELSAATQAIPGMIRQDTMKYYKWLGSRVSGRGAVVELGCWLGQSTAALAEGLADNPAFNGRKLQVFDKFEWDAWLCDYVACFEQELRMEGHSLAASPPQAGDSYLDAFNASCAAHRDLIETHPCYLYNEGESGHLPPLNWSGEPIELIIDDLGNASAMIERVWAIFAPSFIPGVTILVLHQYGHARAENLRQFTRDKAAQLQPVHKPFGAAKGYLFTGQ